MVGAHAHSRGKKFKKIYSPMIQRNKVQTLFLKNMFYVHRPNNGVSLSATRKNPYYWTTSVKYIDSSTEHDN